MESVKKMQSTNKAVVLGANYYIGLSIIRCLGREGIPVVAMDYSKEGTYGFHSRYVYEKVIVPHYRREEEELVKFLVQYAKRQNEKPVLYPTADQYVEFIDKHLAELRKYYLINQTEQGLYTKLMEKDSLADLAKDHGVKIPETIPGNHPNVVEETEKEIGYPCIIKPADSSAFVAIFRRKVFQVTNRAELEEALEKVKNADLDVIIQRIIPGFDDHMYTFDAYLDQNSKVTHWMTAQKQRQYPINYGASVYTAQRYTPELYEIGAPFLESVGFKGFAEIEFKKDAVSGDFYLIEVNVRTTNFNAMIDKVGINMPLLAYKELTGQSIGEKIITENTGKVFWYAYEDLFAIKGYLSTKQLSLGEVIKSFRKEKISAVWASDDMKPAFAFTGMIVNKIANKLTNKLTSFKHFRIKKKK